MNSAQQIINTALRGAEGDTATLHLHSGQTIEGTISDGAEGETIVTETGGAVWHVPVAYIAAVGTAA
ncbi:hypothetical protein [Streptomyces sp. DZ1-3]|uniref:hypothetical protein n=1 Tax=Streptomyces sp. DZ1-3 TaxID=3417466 RepID=UPI003CF4F4F9